VEKKISPHTYRHSMATFLRNQGVPLDVVQLLLGHDNPRTTQLYARLSMAAAREEYDRAMAAFRGQAVPSPRPAHRAGIEAGTMPAPVPALRPAQHPCTAPGQGPGGDAR
jgi:hypothetical protein